MDLQRHKWETAGIYDIIHSVWWVDLRQQLSLHTATPLSWPTPEDKGENRKRKSKNNIGWEKDSVISEGKITKHSSFKFLKYFWGTSKDEYLPEITRCTEIILIKLVGNCYFYSVINPSDSNDCPSVWTHLVPQCFFLTSNTTVPETPELGDQMFS